MSLGGSKVVVLGASSGIGLAVAKAARDDGADVVIASVLPVGRIGRPDEIADAVVFLMRNGYMTGVTLHVDGGHRLV